MSLAEQIVQAGLWLLEEQLTYGTSGNISARCPEGDSILITPSARDFRLLTEKDMIRLHLTSEQAEGCWKPSSEWRLHVAIYRSRPDVQAVIHHHATFASAVAVARKTIPVLLDESVDIGPIPTTLYAPSGSQELAEAVVAELVQGPNATLIANHGAVVVGRDLGEAMHRALEVERLAKIYISAELLGGAHALTEAQIREGQKALVAYRATAAQSRDVPMTSHVDEPVGLKDLAQHSFRAGVTFAHLVHRLLLQKVERF
jgi:L-fuculose-phosphate aldolase